MMYNKILIAVDSSPYSLLAAKKGFALAHQLNATIGLISVINKSKEVINADLGITPEQSESVLIKQAEETIDQLIKMYNEVGNVFRFTPEGFPEKEIINIAREWEADLIVMGTHGRTGLWHLLVGSVAEYVLKHAHIPVMIVSKSIK